jgi:aldehyde dehydrogenase (NAD+)
MEQKYLELVEAVTSTARPLVGAGDEIPVIDPSSGSRLGAVPRGGAAEIDRAVSEARSAYEVSRRSEAPAERGRVLHRIADELSRRAEDFATLETLDTGKPIGQARRDVAGAARYFEYYAGAADKIHGEVIPYAKNVLDYTVLEPVGVSAQITPWNFPLSMLARGLAPALAAGCSVVVKPAAETALTSLALAALAIDVGVPEGVFHVVTGNGRGAGHALASHPGINQITFPGSVGTGIEVAQNAAANVVPAVLELGGKSPFVVFDDADLDAVMAALPRAALVNSGQTCTAASRILIQRGIWEVLLDRIAAAFSALRVGPGLADLDLGALISRTHLENVDGFVRRARDEGAVVVTGGEPIVSSDPASAGGNYYSPTLVTARPDMEVAREEIFGPVLTAVVFEDEAEALEIANGTAYGLVAGVWTGELNRGFRMAERIEAGQVTINSWGAGGVETPFGGMKHSGYGREKSLEGLRSYLRSKNVGVAIGRV